MPVRFINCSACRGCHTGRGGKFCPYFQQLNTGLTAGESTMASSDMPDRDSPEYASYLTGKIAEEEERLRSLQEKTRITELEQQLAELRLRSSELERHELDRGDHLDTTRHSPYIPDIYPRLWRMNTVSAYISENSCLVVPYIIIYKTISASFSILRPLPRPWQRTGRWSCRRPQSCPSLWACRGRRPTST